MLAGNLVAARRNQRLEPFDYQTLGTLAALGHHKGVGRIGMLKFRGFLARWISRSYCLFQMPGWDRRLRIMIDWTVALLFKNDIVKLDLFGQQHPLIHYQQRRMAAKRAFHEVLAHQTTPGEPPSTRIRNTDAGPESKNVAHL